MKKKLLMVFLILAASGFIFTEATVAVPGQPSKVWVSGSRLLVRKRLPNGTLGPERPYIIKGVTWSPATRAPANGPLPPPYPPVMTEYGFFFDWAGRIPQGHVILNYWLKNEFAVHFQQDIDLMQQMNVNTVRVYVDFGEDPAIYGQILDTLYNNGIMVIMTVATSYEDDFNNGNLNNGRFLQMVDRYKNHPAILMWTLGNEWNFNNYYASNITISQATLVTNQAAQLIKAHDSFHPVSSCLGDSFGNEPEDIGPIVNACPMVDTWGINVYRGASFGNLFSQWQAITSKPFYLSEFGTDSYHTDSYTLVPGTNLTLDCVGSENQLMQADHDKNLWVELKSQLSAFYTNKFCLGGLIHEFNDELWKVGCYHAGLGGIVNYSQPRYELYDNEGFYQPGSHPDNIANEEYFGVVDADRNPKTVFLRLANYYCALETRLYPIGNKTVNVNNLLSFVVTAIDVNGDVIELSASGLPPGASFPTKSGAGQVSQTFSWTPTTAGIRSVTFKVTKGSCNPITETISIRVYQNQKIQNTY